ncbi:hypothetical protein [Schleiferilactobacillus shenzhenensis]|uniref:Uncharacterized protein n=1 Tax=Schleiferilactobacillus shenzhenensis LY-73 TaxID=1231336 RepID=U4TQ50_9LACO|nr:hypothetical protein [Schleiferilactobacillus shenzhenensis]ERL64028.1 hypothetical protein L248_1675 [Schleiferilactobacillus shenzhenensis LY-73]
MDTEGTDKERLLMMVYSSEELLVLAANRLDGTKDRETVALLNGVGALVKQMEHALHEEESK